MGKTRIAIFYGDKPNKGDYDNGVWMHLLDIPYIQKMEQAADYDVVIRTLWMESTVQGWSKELRNRYPALIQIGLSDHPLSTHISKMPSVQQVAYLQDLTYLDGIMALTEEERQWYALAVPNVPVIKGGLPFPFEAYEQKYGALERDSRFIGLGVGASDNDRNFVSSAIVMNSLHLDGTTDTPGLFLSLPSQQVTPTSAYSDYFGDIYLHERQNMYSFYERLNQCRFVINLADRNTPGRIQGEAAFFGIPVIGSNRLELQNELFPSLAVSPYSLEDAKHKAEFLLSASREQLDSITNYAWRKLQAYNYRRSKSRFYRLLEGIQEKRKI